MVGIASVVSTLLVYVKKKKHVVGLFQKEITRVLFFVNVLLFI